MAVGHGPGVGPRTQGGRVPATTRSSSRPGGWVPDAPAPDDDRRARVLVLPLAGARDTARAVDEVAAPPARARHRAGPSSSLVPSTVRGGRWRPSPAAAAGAVGVLVVLAVALALRAGALDLVGTPVPDRPAVTPAAATGERAPATAPSSAPSTAPSTVPGAGAGEDVVVHVVGEVARPGLVRVPSGSRVADAVEQAGGAGPLADLTQVNLARTVVDGEQVRLPRQGETVPVPPAPAPGAPAAGAPAGPLDLNAATLDQLDGLDGIGPVLAQRILDWRTERGRFTSVDELGEVEGIGDKLLDRLRDQVRV